MFGFFKKNHSIDIHAPLEGKIIDIEAVPDKTFAEKMMGEGVAIEPTNNILVAPCDGTVALVTPTKHAMVIKTGNIEILLHVGLDTVELNGKGFNVHVQANDSVKRGDKLISFDSDFIVNQGKKLITPIVVINMDKVRKLQKNLTLNNKPILSVEEK